MSGTDFYYVPQIALAEKLAEIANTSGNPKVFFANSGAEAVEASLKLARYHTRREQTIAFFGAFHGRTMGALSLSASKAYQRKYYHPFVPGITHVPYPYCCRIVSRQPGERLRDCKRQYRHIRGRNPAGVRGIFDTEKSFPRAFRHACSHLV